MATKTFAYGTKLQYDSDGVNPYTDTADLISITAPKAEVETAETTHLESTGRYREFIYGFVDPGEMEAMIYFGKAQFNTFHTTILGGFLIYYWRILFPLLSGESTNSRLDFQGLITNFGVEDIEDEAIKAALTVKVSGAITFTQGA